MTTERRLVDPIHFFNSSGLALVTENFLIKQIDELLTENRKLEKLVRQAQKAGFLVESEPA